MKSRSINFHIGGASIFYGILVFIYVFRKDHNFNESFFIALFFTVVLFFVILILHIKTISKLNVFGSITSILLRSILYILALTFALLATFSVYTIYSTTTDQFKNFIVEGVLRGLLYIFMLPFSDQPFDFQYSSEYQSIIFSFFILIFLIGLVSVLSSYIEVRWQEVKQKQLISNAELKALQAQIEPHFLFNSLNTIVSLVRQDPVKAEDLLIKLSDLLHHLFSASNRIKSSLREEINFTKNYLSLMQERFSTNLVIQWNENLKNNEIQVPALLCQPLIENAIKHGWQDKSKPFKISIDIEENLNSIKCIFKDNGIGIQPKRLKNLPQKGHALYNLYERLNLEYQQKDVLQIKSDPNQGTTIILNLPVRQ